MCLATFIQKENDKYTCISNKKIPENSEVFFKVFLFNKTLYYLNYKSLLVIFYLKNVLILIKQYLL